MVLLTLVIIDHLVKVSLAGDCRDISYISTEGSLYLASESAKSLAYKQNGEVAWEYVLLTVELPLLFTLPFVFIGRMIRKLLF
jgi:hypothetical protein